MAILAEKNRDRPPVAAAIVALAPDWRPTVLSWFVGWAASDDLSVAWFADRELVALSRELGHTDEMRAAAPALVAALEARSVPDGLELSHALRQIDSRRSRKAYAEYVRRERCERGASPTKWIP